MVLISKDAYLGRSQYSGAKIVQVQVHKHWPVQDWKKVLFPGEWNVKIGCGKMKFYEKDSGLKTACTIVE